MAAPAPLSVSTSWGRGPVIIATSQQDQAGTMQAQSTDEESQDVTRGDYLSPEEFRRRMEDLIDAYVAAVKGPHRVYRNQRKSVSDSVGSRTSHASQAAEADGQSPQGPSRSNDWAKLLAAQSESGSPQFRGTGTGTAFAPAMSEEDSTFSPVSHVQTDHRSRRNSFSSSTDGEDRALEIARRSALAPVREAFAETASIVSTASTKVIRISKRQPHLDHGDEEGNWRTGCCWCEAIDPASRGRVLLDLLLFLCCLHDAIVVPFTLAWKVQKNTSMKILSVISLLPWLVDMVVNFFTAYYKKGVLVTHLKAIASRYLSTTFFFDLLVNGADAVSVYMELVLMEDSSALRFFRILKLTRLARVVMVLQRYGKQRLVSRNETPSLTMLSLALRLIAVLVFLNHLICCTWFFIASNNDRYHDTGASWLDMKIASGGLRYRDASPVFQYLTSLHWSITQMTPGSMSVVPQNSVERAWNVVCLFIGLFASSLLVSQLSAKMVRVQTLDHERMLQMDMLSRFLSEQSVSRGLAQRIRQQIYERASAVKPLTMKDLPSLECLSSTVKFDLSCAIFIRSLLCHTVFYSWCCCDEDLLLDIAARATELEAYSASDDVFVPLQEADKCYCIQKGVLTYRKDMLAASSEPQRAPSFFDTDRQDSRGALEHWVSEASLGAKVEEHRPIRLGERKWISMIALWCHWTHIGTVQAQGPVQLVVLRVNAVVAVLKRYPNLARINSAYAYAFSSLVENPQVGPIVELDVEPSRLLLAMTQDNRAAICQPIVDSFGIADQGPGNRFFPVRKHRLNGNQSLKLATELEDGLSAVSLGDDCQILRGINLLVLRIENGRGDVLVHVATERNNNLRVNPRLPQACMESQESAGEAAARMVQEGLPHLKGTPVPMSETEASMISYCKQGIRTLTYKHTLNLRLAEEEESVESGDPLPPGSERGPHPARTLLQLMSPNMSSEMSNQSPNRTMSVELIEFTPDADTLQMFAWIPAQDVERLDRPSTIRQFHTLVSELRTRTVGTNSTITSRSMSRAHPIQIMRSASVAFDTVAQSSSQGSAPGPFGNFVTWIGSHTGSTSHTASRMPSMAPSDGSAIGGNAAVHAQHARDNEAAEGDSVLKSADRCSI